MLRSKPRSSRSELATTAPTVESGGDRLERSANELSPGRFLRHSIGDETGDIWDEIRKSRSSSRLIHPPQPHTGQFGLGKIREAIATICSVLPVTAGTLPEARTNPNSLFTEMKSSPSLGRGAGSGLFVQVLGFVVCIGVPAFITAIAPVCVTHFHREGDRVTARTAWNVFYVIPYRVATVDPVTGVADRFHGGSYSRNKSNDRHRTKSEDESFLVIHGPDQEAEAYVSPVNLKSTLAQAQSFLTDPQQTSLRLVTVANWKFSVIFSIPFVLLTLLYLLGIILSIWRGLRKLGGASSPTPIEG